MIRNLPHTLLLLMAAITSCLSGCASNQAIDPEAAKLEVELLHSLRCGDTRNAVDLVNRMGIEALEAPVVWEEDRTTPLIFACQVGNFEVVKALVERGCKINRVVGCGFALASAAAGNWDEIVEYLLEHHANVKLTAAGLTARNYAYLNGHREAEAVLQRYEAARNMP